MNSSLNPAKPLIQGFAGYKIKAREQVGLNRKEFSEYMEIPVRSLEEWEAGRRKMPEYLLRLITYYVRTQEYFKENGIDDIAHLYEG